MGAIYEYSVRFFFRSWCGLCSAMRCDAMRYSVCRGCDTYLCTRTWRRGGEAERRGNGSGSGSGSGSGMAASDRMNERGEAYGVYEYVGGRRHDCSGEGCAVVCFGFFSS